jgi:hypothetical protein
MTPQPKQPALAACLPGAGHFWVPDPTTPGRFQCIRCGEIKYVLDGDGKTP